MLRAVLYWAAVFAVSMLFVIALVLFFESRDQSGVKGSTRGGVLTPLVRVL